MVLFTTSSVNDKSISGDIEVAVRWACAVESTRGAAGLIFVVELNLESYVAPLGFGKTFGWIARYMSILAAATARSL